MSDQKENDVAVDETVVSGISDTASAEESIVAQPPGVAETVATGQEEGDKKKAKKKKDKKKGKKKDKKDKKGKKGKKKGKKGKKK